MATTITAQQEREVLASPATRRLVHLVLTAADDRDPVDAIDDVEVALEILKGRLQRLQDDQLAAGKTFSRNASCRHLQELRQQRRELEQHDATYLTRVRHTCNNGDGPYFGRRTAGCPRCDELTAGAAPREWSGSRRRYN